MWPDRRSDVLSGLDTLAAAPPTLRPGQSDPRWPDVTNAVHWLLDDTWWDHHSPEDSVGILLMDKGEAAAVAEVVRVLVEVSDRCGPVADDSLWFSDRAWPELRRAAAHAADLLRRSDGRAR